MDLSDRGGTMPLRPAGRPLGRHRSASGAGTESSLAEPSHRKRAGLWSSQCSGGRMARSGNARRIIARRRCGLRRRTATRLRFRSSLTPRARLHPVPLPRDRCRNARIDNIGVLSSITGGVDPSRSTLGLWLLHAGEHHCAETSSGVRDAAAFTSTVRKLHISAANTLVCRARAYVFPHLRPRASGGAADRRNHRRRRNRRDHGCRALRGSRLGRRSALPGKRPTRPFSLTSSTVTASTRSWQADSSTAFHFAARSAVDTGCACN